MTATNTLTVTETVGVKGSDCMTDRCFERLSPLGKRRMRIIQGVEAVVYTTIMVGVGYCLCFMVYGLQLLLGVAN